MGLRILRAGTYRRTPWKNGGGETAEIAVFPEGAGIDAFAWRVSMATVASDGPFSIFEGVDRTLSVLDGDGITLEIDGMGARTLTSASMPFGFPADALTKGLLTGGPITDLNVMTRRGLYTHEVTRFDLAGATELVAGAGKAVLFSAAAALRIEGQGFGERLGRYDAVILGEDPASIQVEGHGSIFLIGIKPALPG